MMPLFRSALFNLGVGILTFGIGLALLPLLASQRSTAWVIRFWARSVLWWLALTVGLRARVTGLHNIPAGPAILAAKHQSAFDTVFWLTQEPLPAYVLKRELLWIPIYGWFAARAGMIPVDRKDGARALRRMLRAAQAAIAAGRKIVIFPEGTRTAPGETRAWQPGVAGLVRLGVPLVPVATDSGAFWGRRSFLKRPGVLTVAVLPAEPPGQPRDALLRRAQAAVEAESLRLLMSHPVDKTVETAPSDVLAERKEAKPRV
jgi:1-acyl-sn-glycerol-3-phosphate acyltransferase